MTQINTELKDEVQDKLEKVLELYQEFQAAWSEIGSAVRKLGMQQTFDRVDAYPGWSADRDLGCRMTMVEWIEEVAEDVSTLGDPTCYNCDEAIRDWDVSLKIETEEGGASLVHKRCLMAGDVVVS